MNTTGGILAAMGNAGGRVWATEAPLIAKFLSGPDAGPNLMGLASLNATVVAILFGFVAMYIHYAHTRTQEREDALLETAREVNNIDFGWPYGWPSDPTGKILDMGDEERARIIKSLSPPAGLLGNPRPAAETGAEIMKGVWILSNNYPFYGHMQREQRNAGSTWSRSGRRVAFESISDVERWLRAVRDAQRAVGFPADGIPERIKELVRAYRAERDKALSPTSPEVIAFTKQQWAKNPNLSQAQLHDFERFIQLGVDGQDPERFLEHFLSKAKEVFALSERVQTKLDAYKNGRREVRQYLTPMVLLGLCSLLGVVIPLFLPLFPLPQLWRDILAGVAVFIPLILYLCLGLSILKVAFRQ